jgi:hypothetical protein
MPEDPFVPGIDPGLKSWLKMREEVRNARTQGGSSTRYNITSDIAYRHHYHWIDIIYSLSDSDFIELSESSLSSFVSNLSTSNGAAVSNVCSYQDFVELLLKERQSSDLDRGLLMEKLYSFAVNHRSLILLELLIEGKMRKQTAADDDDSSSGLDVPSHAIPVERDLRGYNINYRFTANHRTLLHLAVIHGDIRKVQYLLSHGADSSITDSKHRTCLHFSIQPDSIFHSPDITHLLIQNGAAVNAKDYHGRTPLHYACLVKSFSLTRILLENKADMTVEDEKKKTPLNYSTDVRVTLVFLCSFSNLLFPLGKC